MNKSFNPARNALAAGIIASGLALAAPLASAVGVTVSCPGTVATTDREFSLTTAAPGATCLLTGTGNLNGNGDAINALGYITLDKSDDGTTGPLPNALSGSPSLVAGLAGTFSFSAPGYKDFVISFKSGEGQLDPDWAAFSLPAGITSGSWAISGQQALSHVNLYGKVNPVPVPAAVWLLGSALAGVGAFKRRKDA